MLSVELELNIPPLSKKVFTFQIKTVLVLNTWSCYLFKLGKTPTFHSLTQYYTNIWMLDEHSKFSVYCLDLHKLMM
jgi:hypothetical protein